MQKIIGLFCTLFLLNTSFSQVNKNNAAKIEAVAKSDSKTLSILLNENFDNNSNKWSEWDNEGSSSKVINGNYQFTAKQNYNYASWLGFPYLSNSTNDFAIETQIFLHNTETGNPNDSYWLLWGLGNNGKDFYAFGIYPTGKFQYGKQINGNWDGKLGTMYSPFINVGANKVNVLRIEKKNDSISFYINGNKVHKTNYEVFNDTHAAIGFQINNKKKVDIDYLKIFKGSEVTTVKVNTVLSPEPYETTYANELRVSNDYQARGLAFAKYVDALLTTQLTESDKGILLVKKTKEIIEIDFMAYQHMMMKIKPANVSFVNQKISPSLTAEQKSAFKAACQYAIDEYSSLQNNTAKPLWPSNVPKPGFGWGKTVSSDVIVAKSQQPIPIVKNKDEFALSELVGIVFKYSSPNGIDRSFCKVTGYKNRNEIYINFFKGGNRTVTYDDLIDNKNGNGFDVAEIVTCNVCSGKGTVTFTSSHTNDYQYTLGQKHVYTTTSTSNCSKCAGNGFNYQ